MNRRITLILLSIVSLLLLSSCNKVGEILDGDKKGGILVSEEQKSNARMEQIVSAIKGKDKEALKSLFSKKALDESNDFDGGMDSLFNFIQGGIESWKSDGWASDESMGGGKRSLMIRFGFKVTTDKNMYSFFVIDYNTDTINPDNQGVYMLQVRTSGYNKDLGSWQERMRAGFYIPEE